MHTSMKATSYSTLPGIMYYSCCAPVPGEHSWGTFRRVLYYRDVFLQSVVSADISFCLYLVLELVLIFSGREVDHTTTIVCPKCQAKVGVLTWLPKRYYFSRQQCAMLCSSAVQDTTPSGNVRVVCFLIWLLKVGYIRRQGGMVAVCRCCAAKSLALRWRWLGVHPTSAPRGGASIIPRKRMLKPHFRGYDMNMMHNSLRCREPLHR